MILKFNSKSTRSACARLLGSRAASTYDTPCETSKITTQSPAEPVSAAIAKQYSKKSTPKKNHATSLSTNDLVRVRTAQRHENLLQDWRRKSEKASLYSYLNVCVDVGQINRAFNTIVKLNKTTRGVDIDIDHYNVVLKGWAKLASLAQVVETRMHMTRNKVEPNAESYLYILLAYSKRPETRKSQVRLIVKEMESRGIDPKKLFQQAYLSLQERKLIKNLLKTSDPEYNDTFWEIPINYDCKLLANFDKSPVTTYDFLGNPQLKSLSAWAVQQRNTESKTSISIESVAKVEEKPEQLEKYFKLLNKFRDLWRQSLTKALDEKLEVLQKQSDNYEKIHLYPYLCCIGKSMLVNMMLDEIESNANFSSYSTYTTHLHQTLGNRVMIRYLRMKAIQDGSNVERLNIYNQYLREFCTNPGLMGQINSRQYLQSKAAETKNYAIYKDRPALREDWPNNISVAIGKFLYGLILRETKFDPDAVRNPNREINTKNLVHGFYTAYFQVDCSTKIKEEFRAHKDFEKLHRKASAVRLRFDYSFLPSTSPPMPWLSRTFGGYITNKSDLTRVAHSAYDRIQTSDEMIEIEPKLYPSLDSLNAIGLCPWIVNKEILDLAIQCFQSGGDKDLNIPIEESKMVSQAPALKANSSKADKILYNREKKKYDQKRREMYSLWRDCLYRLSIANHFRDRTLWFPHNMDFRGRTYPIPPHFNHLGADLARSLLLFAKGQPLGDKGLDWLKIHLINLVGDMKRNSLSERLDYANSILHMEVLDSADNPWDGRRWWTRNEAPWQVLACCKEISKAIRSRDHRSYVSHFPIHQDGSCNGLQHYAALGRDPGGAEAVNLTPSDKPQDVYSQVVNIVESMRKRDAAQGDKVAAILEGFVQRKVIKQTVMTTVYGVTKYGARNQIARGLIAKGYNESEVWAAANYLTGKTFDSIGRLFDKSRLIQDWFNECAFVIASRCREPVRWETPLGFPIVQPYTTNSKSSSRLLSSDIGIYTPFNSSGNKLNATKQKTAFPPNYIHSLDSSHMMLTSIYCQRAGITFVSVHDCYWTHPSSVNEMNRICREQFIALHSEPLLNQLSEQFLRNYINNNNDDSSNNYPHQRTASHKENGVKEKKSKIGKSLLEMYEPSKEAAKHKGREVFMAVPPTGDLDLNQVKQSTYFFS